MIERLEADSPEVQRFLAELAALPETTVPAPSPALASLLGDATFPQGPGAGEDTSGADDPDATVVRLADAASTRAHHPRGRRLTGWMIAAVAAAALLVTATGTGLAAAANELPSPLQDAIADFSEHHLPFQVPHSTDGERGGAPGVEKTPLVVVPQPAPRTWTWRTPPRSGPPRQPSEPSPQDEVTETPSASGSASPSPSTSPSETPSAGQPSDGASPPQDPATPPGTDVSPSPSPGPSLDPSPGVAPTG
ncbi:hypothetical protein EKO23_22875 [Nocardioides guangzhouensis]|uniref:Uncharacterized protein n=1 Tax=Nocardioides guangzhouensis TaxID=2497878 RepID=A0A4V1XY35_9ACTN|nr:hypothetical protein [Nocardioides guangzhouensis]RYP81869.1 hypothetical protein EKO23_22875 [Nocardioides guangzhouensis]